MVSKLKINNVNLLEEVKLLKTKIEMLTSHLKDYKDLANTAVQRGFEDETTIDIDNTLYESDGDSDGEYKLKPLKVGQGFSIEHRDDGYINVTNMCKAGGKQFKHWKGISKTEDFLRALSSTVGITTVELIKQNTGRKGERQTWVHPQIAMNIAHWMSSQFNVKVSGWVYEIMMTGKVDVTNTTSFNELKKDNKTQSMRIKYLTKKYVKAQPRVHYKERNVVYILTTKLMKKDRRYIMGKATNLTNRLSTYNKGDEHQVVYYASCGNAEKMALVEKMTFQHLKEYREQANRERFILPEDEGIEFFSDIINNAVEYFKK
jgi:hypothetical protein